MIFPAFEELAFLCDAKGWRLELARVRAYFELRVRNVRGDEIGMARASQAAHLGDAARALRAKLEQRV